MTVLNALSENPAADRSDVLTAEELSIIRLPGLAMLAAACLVIALSGGERLRESLFDFYQVLQPRQVDRFPARIVEIDEASLKEFGPWPWSRTRLAELAQRSFDAGALAIGFDMVFPDRDQTAVPQFLQNFPSASADVKSALAGLPDPDQVFADTVGRLPVVLGRAATTDARVVSAPDAEPVLSENLFSGVSLPESVLNFPAIYPLLPDLEFAAAGQGLLNAGFDSDGLLRRIPLVARVDGHPMPTIALEVLRVAADADGYNLEGDETALHAITLGDRRIPTDPDGRLRMHFSPPLAARTVSAIDLLEGRLAEDVFRNSVVFIGAAALGLTDVVATPLAPESYGVDAHAQAVEIILGRNWLVRPEWSNYAEAAMTLLMGLLLLTALPRLRTGAALIISIVNVTAIFAASFAAFAQAKILIDPVMPGIGLGLAVLTTLAMMLIEADRRRRELREILIEERVATAQLAGELEAAFDIQTSMLPDQDQLAALSPQADIAAVLEPARSVGGDLFDAFMLDENHLFFMVGDVTGKGVPAALFMALSKALTKNALMRLGRNGGLGAAVAQANSEISGENKSEMFVTALLGVIDLRSGDVEMVNAGHNDPVLLDRQGIAREIPLEGGLPFCVLEENDYPVESFRLSEGDFLILTTDGVSEARNREGAFFGVGRILATLGSLDQGEGAWGGAAKLISDVRDFEAGNEPSDDLTVLILHYCGMKD